MFLPVAGEFRLKRRTLRISEMARSLIVRRHSRMPGMGSSPENNASQIDEVKSLGISFNSSSTRLRLRVGGVHRVAGHASGRSSQHSSAIWSQSGKSLEFLEPHHGPEPSGKAENRVPPGLGKEIVPQYRPFTSIRVAVPVMASTLNSTIAIPSHFKARSNCTDEYNNSGLSASAMATTATPPAGGSSFSRRC